MSKSFMQSVKNTMNNEFNYSVTENGALGYRTTGKELLDLNFSVASMRGMSDQEIVDRFMAAFYEDRLVAMKWLFYARDIRGGLGERRLFRVILRSLAESYPNEIGALLFLVPEYGRWDDLMPLLHTKLRAPVLKLINRQLVQDCNAYKSGEHISLLAKWLPSPNASSPKTREYASIICHGIGMEERSYRKILSSLRAYLKVVERQMSAQAWGEIAYESVPSRANLIYNKAFLRNDEERRRAFLASLERGETKINASTLFPHDIVHQYNNRLYSGEKDATLEQLWKALPDQVAGCGNTIVVADGSGSMLSRVDPHSDTSAMSVANALAIYFAERSSGQFRDQYITFSRKPRLVDLSKGRSLLEKLQIARRYNEVANTNIEAVFDLILTTAVREHMDQADLPKNILIISDMEFDICAEASGVVQDSWGYNEYSRPNARLFSVLANRYAQAGYQLPRLVFWNVNSRTGTIPVKENNMGVALVSGFSVNIVKMVMSGKLDPYECLLETLNAPRYAPIADHWMMFEE